jgi:hypothetical protein
MEIDNREKIALLQSALLERYSALHKIRDRAQSIGIWVLGILLGASGWLIQSTVKLSVLQKAIYVLGIAIAFLVLRFWYLGDLRKGFQIQQRVVARIEKALGFFTPGFFDSSAEPLYPKAWEEAGRQSSGGNFFHSTYALLYVGVAFLVIAVLTK